MPTGGTLALRVSRLRLRPPTPNQSVRKLTVT